jgi:hypothetical protein
MITFTVEVPFASDHAPFKVIRTGESGKRRIVSSAQTLAKAEQLMRDWQEREKAGELTR